ncbi:polyprenyl synthetase family protein [bacterium]|nr:polyprenyl synthetase family protein [bacterium]
MINFDTIPWLKQFIDETDRSIAEVFENTGSADLKEILKSHHQGGKRLRPTIIGASARLGDKPSDTVKYGAVAVELLHLASLFHDDVLDNTDSRRMNLAAQKKIGNLTSILSGDYLLTESINVMIRHLPQEVTEYFLATIKKMIKSEIYSHKLLYNLDISKKEFLQIIDEKTASLFALASSLGIRITSDNADSINRLTQFGYHLGMAYQLTDDLEDMFGLIEGSDNDLQHGYISLPIIELLNAAADDLKPEIRQWIKHIDREKSIKLIQIMKSYSIFKVMFVEIKKYVGTARENLLGLVIEGPQQTDSLNFLLDLCTYIENKTESIISTYDKLALEKPIGDKKKVYAFA